MFLFTLVVFRKDKKTELKFNRVLKEEAKDYASAKKKNSILYAVVYYVLSTLIHFNPQFFAEEMFVRIYFCTGFFCI